MAVILAIETSCDDTSAAVIVHGELRSNVVSSQLDHAKYGGVVPEVASRAHLVLLEPVIRQALDLAKTELDHLDAIAFTRGPGLIGSLLVGASYAKGLALNLSKPLIAVHHMRAHVLAHFIDAPRPTFPFLCLTVSGGHTQLLLIHSPSSMEVLGETIDDAAGEAFDKAGKMLGLPYPAGPEIDRLAKLGNPEAFTFTEPRVGELEFSFSGLKTSIRYFLRDQTALNPDFIQQNLADLCASIQDRIVSILIGKMELAAVKTNIDQIAIAGGVSANSGLRTALEVAAKKNNWTTYIPAFQYCTDNAGMIAMAAHFQYLAGDFCDHTIEPIARWPIESPTEAQM